MSGQYILDGKAIVHEPDLMKWGRWLEKHTEERVVARTEVAPGVDVSTVFLGLDHSFREGAAPIVFETMVFGGDHDGNQDRYATWEEAEAGHAAMVERCRA